MITSNEYPECPENYIDAHETVGDRDDVQGCLNRYIENKRTSEKNDFTDAQASEYMKVV
jgi:hypothetical protein